MKICWLEMKTIRLQFAILIGVIALSIMAVSMFIAMCGAGVSELAKWVASE